MTARANALIDLHRHLEGSIRSSTAIEVARRDRDEFGSIDRPRDELVFQGESMGLLPYLQKVDRVIPLLTTAADWRRVAHEAIIDAFEDGLDYAEFRFAPWLIQSETGIDAHAVIDAVSDGMTAGTRLTGMPVNLIGVIVRDLGPEAAIEQAKLFASRTRELIAIDLAGNESGFPAADFAPAFQLARDAGLRLTAHAGEAAGPESVWAVINELGVERVGHGLRAADDPRLMDTLAARGITLDLALSSNVHTGATPSFERHPVRELLAAGVPVTLNTDDPRASNVTLTHEHDIAVSRVGLTPDQVSLMAKQSESAAFRSQA